MIVVFQLVAGVGIQENILSNEEYGFKRGHPTHHAVVNIVNNAQSKMDHKLFTCAILIDLAKAFDTVDHLILLRKLYACLHLSSIRGCMYDWLHP